jgi:hypothetical protein
MRWIILGVAILLTIFLYSTGDGGGEEALGGITDSVSSIFSSDATGEVEEEEKTSWSFIGIVTTVVLLVLGTLGSILALPFFKGQLTNNPDNPGKIALFTEVQPGRTKMKMRGGRYIGPIKGGEAPHASMNILWWLFEAYCYTFFGLRVIGVPFIQTLYTYDLPHSRKNTASTGKLDLEAVPTGAPGFRSDHVRNEFTTWYFEVSGAEVDTVPFTVKGSVQILIESGREADALFKTNSWNELLDQAIKNVTRNTLATTVTLDDVIGRVSKDIWATTTTKGASATTRIAESLRTGLVNYTIDGDPSSGNTLQKHVALRIGQVDIADLAPDIEDAGKADLYNAAIQLQKARGRSIAGEGEAEYQRKVLDALAQNPDLAKENVWAEAMRDAAKNGSVDALLAVLLKNFTKK